MTKKIIYKELPNIFETQKHENTGKQTKKYGNTYFSNMGMSEICRNVSFSEIKAPAGAT